MGMDLNMTSSYTRDSASLPHLQQQGSSSSGGSGNDAER
jgi:hypothetical protein